MNPVLYDLYEFQKYGDIEDYYKYRKLCVDTLSWRMYSFYWKSKYFWNLLVGKRI
ncbi:hypothetical protein [Vibrio phage vB_VibM_10AMN]|uniref:Uncharacterized protein n=1 Tax=Staphylococcus phage vB_VibM_10AMN12 TaxID=3076785 RepID=A0AA96R3Q2_9CAUD|nr:hypothetical protein [Vibrio phage vB_VibM_10AMN]WNO47411.1 hypothetical protein [Staphylococcus phage vB_VibM_10AMN12]